jgi:hypothetical protein
MKGLSYSQFVSMLSYYLWRYPSVEVALECVLEDIEGEQTATLAKEARTALERIQAGEKDYEVLLDWADKTGAKDLENFALKIKEAYEKKQDIGFYVRRFVPVVLDKNKEDNRKQNNYRQGHKKHGQKRKRK